MEALEKDSSYSLSWYFLTSFYRSLFSSQYFSIIPCSFFYISAFLALNLQHCAQIQSLSLVLLESQRYCSFIISCLSLSSQMVKYYIILSFYISLRCDSSSVCLRRCQKRSDMIFAYSFWMSILFSRLRMMTCSSIQRLFMMQKGYRIKLPIKTMEKDDIFAEVAQQLQITNELTNATYSHVMDESREALREDTSWTNFTNHSGSGEFLKRRPMKSIQKNKGRVSENVIYSTQAIQDSSKFPLEKGNLNTHLNRLEKTLNCSKNSKINPHFKRQKTLIKRLGIANKQNKNRKDQVAVGDCTGITSQFLQQIRVANEDLYEIYLQLYRFYQKQKQENERIVRECKQASDELQQNNKTLQQLRKDLQTIHEKIQNKNSNQNKTELAFMKDSFFKFFSKHQTQ